MMDINPDTSSNMASSLSKPKTSGAEKASKAGSALSKGGNALASAAGSVSEKASDRATATSSTAVPHQDVSPTSFHKGGTVPKDGSYKLKKGEHVLTGPEAKRVRRTVMMSAGLKSMAKPSPKAK